MRPVRVEVEGFSAYRQQVSVDFAGVDFFSLSGPTGSGKSSLIDAMVFALFGRVPRLGGNAVAPAITAGADRARVRLDFDVGEMSYSAVRMAQRTSTGGASVKEARLELGEQVVASGADEVTKAVEDLLKLRFEDFTRTVVLPQGEFARFLTATKAERQGLLRNLLGMDVYTRVRELAKTRAAVSAERAANAKRALDALELADEDARRAATERRDALAALAESMTEREKELETLETAVAAAESRARSLDDSTTRLGAIEQPGRLTELDSLTAGARSALVDAEEACVTAADGLRDVEAAFRELPTADHLAAWRRSRERLAEIDERMTDPSAEQAAERAEKSEKSLDEGLADLDDLRLRLQEARSEHASHVLTAQLAVGEPCPVCARDVTEIPDRAAPSTLDGLVTEESRLAGLVDDLRAEAERARTALARAETARAGLAEQRELIVAELEHAPSLEELDLLQVELEGAMRQLDEARKELSARQYEEKEARSALENLADDSRRVSKLLREAERSVADLGPPLSESDDVVVQWKELIEWREETLDELRRETSEVEEAVTEARTTAHEGRKGLRALLEEHGVEPLQPYAVEVATSLQEVRGLVEAQEKAATDAAGQGIEIEAATRVEAVAQALANHLRANGFEQWLMAGALTDLVSGANDLLGQLSGDGYSLNSDESGSFSIVDHRNADEMRSVSTLSGGETFLVSLALALSLAETLAAKGGSGLDAIILDEGFGSLDDESLDTVASVLEELTGRGLMVGVITHVKELAARAPVRYEVRREPGGAMVRLAS